MQDKIDWQHDLFAAMSSIFEECKRNFVQAINSDDYLTIDDTLIDMKTQVSDKNADKPVKYDMLYKSINASHYLYAHHSCSYCWKSIVDADDHCISGTINCVKCLVKNLTFML